MMNFMLKEAIRGSVKIVEEEEEEGDSESAFEHRTSTIPDAGDHCRACAFIAALFVLVPDLGCNEPTEDQDEPRDCIYNTGNDEVGAGDADAEGSDADEALNVQRVEHSSESDEEQQERSVNIQLAPAPRFGSPVDLTHLIALAKSVRKGLAKHNPVLTADGSGGAYILHSAHNTKLAVFKPMAEEPGAPANPRTTGSKVQKIPRRFGFVPGEGALKEVLAYLLDKDHFAGVPPTVLMDIAWPGKSRQLGSVQQFVEHGMCAWDVGPQNFSVDEVHAIALLDLRLCNTDRHGGNILLAPDCYSPTAPLHTTESEDSGNSEKGEADDEENGGYFDNYDYDYDYDDRPKRNYDKKVRLVPIDHGYCLPAYPHLGELWFEWMTWPQSKQPLSPRALEYVSRIDERADAELALAMGLLNEGSAITLCIGTMLVKRCAASGLTIEEMAHMACRMEGPDTPSALEKICAQAERECGWASPIPGIRADTHAVHDCDQTLYEEEGVVAACKKVAQAFGLPLVLCGSDGERRVEDVSEASHLLQHRDAFFKKVGQLLNDEISSVLASRVTRRRSLSSLVSLA